MNVYVGNYMCCANRSLLATVTLLANVSRGIWLRGGVFLSDWV